MEQPVVTYLGPRGEAEVEVEPRELAQVVKAQAMLSVSGELRSPGPRETLRQRVEEHADELADVIVDAALGDGKVNQAKLALDAIHRADPPVRGSVGLRVPRTAQEVNALSMSELLQVAKAVGIER